MTTESQMLGRLLASRWKHLMRLVPLGAVVGLVFGYVFKDILYGLSAGCVIGLLFGIMLVVRNPS